MPKRLKSHSEQMREIHRKRHDQLRGSADQRGYGKDHRKWREQVLKDGPICAACKKNQACTPITLNPLDMGELYSA